MYFSINVYMQYFSKGLKPLPTGMSMELSNYLVSWVVTYLGDLQPTYIGVIIYLLSTMDIPVVIVTYPLLKPPKSVDIFPVPFRGGVPPSLKFLKSAKRVVFPKWERYC